MVHRGHEDKITARKGNVGSEPGTLRPQRFLCHLNHDVLALYEKLFNMKCDLPDGIMSHHVLILQGLLTAVFIQMVPEHHLLQIQEIFVEEVPVLYLQIDDWYNMFSADVKGVPEDALFGTEVFATAWQWYLEE